MSQPGAKLAAAITLASAMLAGCLFPEKFTAKVDVKKDGSFSYSYDGILTFLPARATAGKGDAAAKEGGAAKGDGKVKAQAKAQSQLENVERELREKLGCQEAKHVERGQFQVRCARSGKLEKPVYFPSEPQKIFSIVPEPGGTVKLVAASMGKDQIAKLREIGLALDGRLEVTTDAKVVKANATTAPAAGASGGPYVWELKSLDSPAPEMVIKLD